MRINMDCTKNDANEQTVGKDDVLWHYHRGRKYKKRCIYVFPIISIESFAN